MLLPLRALCCDVDGLPIRSFWKGRNAGRPAERTPVAPNQTYSFALRNASGRRRPMSSSPVPHAGRPLGAHDDGVFLSSSRRDLASGSFAKNMLSFAQMYSGQRAQDSMLFSIAHRLISHRRHPENNLPFTHRQPSQSLMSATEYSIPYCSRQSLAISARRFSCASLFSSTVARKIGHVVHSNPQYDVI